MATFTRSAVATNNISVLADEPVLTPANLKLAFDQYGIDDKSYTNSTLIAELESTTAGSSGTDRIGSGPILGVTGDTAYEQLSDLKTQINGVVAGAIPNGTLEITKMADVYRDCDMVYSVGGGILGSVGDCESITGWVTTDTLTADASNKVQGSYSLKCLSTGGNATATYNIISILDPAKYYFISGWVKHGLGTLSRIRLVPDGSGAVTKSAGSVTDTTQFINVGAVLLPSDWGTGSTMLDIQLYTPATTGDYGYYDSIKIWEITAADSVLTEAQLLAKYPNVVTSPAEDQIQLLQSATYTLDAVTKKTVTFTYSGQNVSQMVTSITGGNTVTSDFTYDANGNTVKVERTVS